MATQMTQTTALVAAAEFLAAYSQGIGATLEPAAAAEVAVVLAHIAEMKSKPRTKASGPTKAQLVNLGLAHDVAVLVWDAPDPVTSRTVVDTLGDPQVTSTQKACHLLKLGMTQGWLTRLDVKGQVLWTRGDIDPRA